MKRTNVIAWIGVLVSVGVIAFMVSQFDVKKAAGVFGMADLIWVVPAAALYLALFPLRGARWSLLMSGVKPVPIAAATEVFVVGAMANNVMPARLGDVARAFVLSRRVQVPATTTFANVMLERIIDGVVVVGLLVAVLVYAPPGANWVRSVGVTMALLFTGALFGCVLLVVSQRRALALIAWLVSPLPGGLANKIHGRVALLIEGIGVLRRPGALAGVLALSLVVWTLEVGVYALAQRAFGFNIPPSGLVLTMAVLTLGLTAPSAPGFVGVFEGLIVAAVVLYGVDPSVALAFAIMMHLIHYVPVTLLGLAYAWRSGLKIRELHVAASGSSGLPATDQGV